MVRESWVRKEDLIVPIFIKEGLKGRNPIPSMPGIFQFGEEEFLKEVEELLKLGLKRVILFGIPQLKDSVGSDALNPEGLIARSVRRLKKEFQDEVVVVTDLCFCEYTDHGHCGIINPHLRTVDNRETLSISQRQALIHAEAGADIIAPSGMMDGIVKALREALNQKGFDHIPIMSYSTKFASAFYGPFRDAAESAPVENPFLPPNRESYQMDIGNQREAILESLIDDQEGADILMVKPALAFLDVVAKIRERTLKPLAVYNVSGEYSLVKAAAAAGFVDEKRIVLEILTSFKRAGADIIITYHGKEVAPFL
jgi:porphobilinogen synthase